MRLDTAAIKEGTVIKWINYYRSVVISNIQHTGKDENCSACYIISLHVTLYHCMSTDGNPEHHNVHLVRYGAFSSIKQ